MGKKGRKIGRKLLQKFFEENDMFWGNLYVEKMGIKLFKIRRQGEVFFSEIGIEMIKYQTPYTPGRLKFDKVIISEMGQEITKFGTLENPSRGRFFFWELLQYNQIYMYNY